MYINSSWVTFPQAHHVFLVRSSTKKCSRHLQTAFLFEAMRSYTAVHLARIYPAGYRVDSSNYDPQVLRCQCCGCAALPVLQMSWWQWVDDFSDLFLCDFGVVHWKTRRMGWSLMYYDVLLFLENVWESATWRWNDMTLSSISMSGKKSIEI